MSLTMDTSRSPRGENILDGERPFVLYLGTVVMRVRGVSPRDMKKGKKVKLTKRLLDQVLALVAEQMQAPDLDEQTLRESVELYVGTEWRYEKDV